jgi:hypothetical protein
VKEHIFTLALMVGFYAVSATRVAAAPPVKDDPNASPTQNWDKVLSHPNDLQFVPVILAACGTGNSGSEGTGSPPSVTAAPEQTW